MAVRCANHETTTYHESVSEVRQCFAGESVKTSVTNHDLYAGPAKPATDKQLVYVESLLFRNGAEYLPGITTLDRKSISGVIDALKSGEWSKSADYRRIEKTVTKDAKSNGDFDTETLEDGFYVLNEEVYKVIVAVHGSGRKYAKRLDKETGVWERARGAVFNLRPEHKMTLDQALEVAKAVSSNPESRLYGRCFRCGLPLTKDESIERMMGDWCAGQFG